MDSNSLTAFKAVYERGSFAKAAEVLYISPQGLGKVIGRLESELGCTLFERTPHGVEPTGSARAVYPRVGEAIRVLDDVCHMVENPGTHELRVAVSSGYVMRLGKDFANTYEQCLCPGWRLRMEEFLDEAVLDQVESGDADCGFSPAPVEREGLEAVCVARHPYLLLVRDDDVLASKSRLEYADLDGRRLVALGNGHAPFKTISAHLARAGAHPASLSPVIEITTGIDLARRGEAGCFITDFAASSFACDLRSLPFDDASLTWDLSFVTRRGESPSSQCEFLLRHAQDWIAAHRDCLFQ